MAEEVTIVVVDTDESDIFGSIGSRDSYSKGLERPSARGEVMGVERNETTEGGHMLGKIMLKTVEIVIRPLGWCFFRDHGGYGLNPVGVTIDGVVGESKHESTNRWVKYIS